MFYIYRYSIDIEHREILAHSWEVTRQAEERVQIAESKEM